MVQITRWKRFSLFLLWLWGSTAHAQGSGNFPKVSNVGIIPVRWQGANVDGSGLHAFRKHVDEVLPQIVRASYRFRVLNDELVKEFWSTSEGRAELVQDYELHAFINLLAIADGDTVRLQLRLLSPSMQIYLLEEEALGLTWVNAATASIINEKLSDLVFRMINRLPIDVTVLAVQGHYVTLSGGEKQGLRLGDELVIHRPEITNVHPANGAWLDFRNAKMGTARVVDLNENTAIGKLISQSYEDAIAVGDGAKIYNIPGRARFSRLAQANELVDHGPPQSSRHLIPEEKVAPKASQPEKIETSKTQRPQDVSKGTDSPLENDEALDQIPANEENELGITGELLRIFHGVDIYTGIDSWKVSGGASASSSLAPWLLNYFTASMRKPFAENVDLGLGGALHLGKTKNGSYTGFDLTSKLAYLIPTEGLASFYRIGGLGRFESRNIRNETFGGGDYVLLGGFAGLEGRVRYIDVPLEWIADIAIIPVGIGQAGYTGKKKSLKSVYGYEFEFGVIKPSTSDIDLGGTISHSSLGFEAGKSFSKSSTKLLLHARYQF